MDQLFAFVFERNLIVHTESATLYGVVVGEDETKLYTFKCLMFYIMFVIVCIIMCFPYMCLY